MPSDERTTLVVLRQQLEKAKAELGRPGARNARNSGRIKQLDDAMTAVEVMIERGPRNRLRAG